MEEESRTVLDGWTENSPVGRYGVPEEEEWKGQTPSFFGRVGDGGGERGREGEGSEGATDKQIGTPCIGKSESYKG